MRILIIGHKISDGSEIFNMIIQGDVEAKSEKDAFEMAKKICSLIEEHTESTPPEIYFHKNS